MGAFCVHAIQSLHFVGKLVGIEVMLLSIVIYWIVLDLHVASWSLVLLTYHRSPHVSGEGDQKTAHFFSMNSQRHLLWIMSDATKAGDFGDRYYYFSWISIQIPEGKDVKQSKLLLELILHISCISVIFPGNNKITSNYELIWYGRQNTNKPSNYGYP